MKVLFITATRIGDAVLSTGVLGHLIERHPDSRFTIAAGPAAAPLFESVPRLDRLIVVEKRRWSLHWLGLYAAVVGTRWDLVVDLRGSALPYFIRAGRRIGEVKGEAGESRVEQLARSFALAPAPAPRLYLAARHERAAR
jgi:lipopolysaccharide export system permease protein